MWSWWRWGVGERRGLTVYSKDSDLEANPWRAKLEKLVFLSAPTLCNDIEQAAPLVSLVPPDLQHALRHMSRHPSNNETLQQSHIFVDNCIFGIHAMSICMLCCRILCSHFGPVSILAPQLFAVVLFKCPYTSKSLDG